MGDVLGLLFGVLTMIPFIDQQAPDPTIPSRTTNVRIGAGLGDDGITDSEHYMGSIPGFAIFDIGGNKIGNTYAGDNIHTWADVPVVGQVTAQSEYISVSAGKNAICIAYITVADAAGTKNTWTGDIAAACGYPTYHSNLKLNDQNYMPNCMWLNGDSSAKGWADDTHMPYRGMGIHHTDFKPASAQSKKVDGFLAEKDTLCKSPPRWGLYPTLSPDDYIPYFSPALVFTADDKDADTHAILDSSHWLTNTAPYKEPEPPLPVEPKKHRRSQMRRDNPPTNSTFMARHLVVSSLDAHSALELCERENSFGPDFVSYVEGFYCDMANKQVYPLCVGNDKVACFDLGSKTLRAAPGINRRDQSIPDKFYEHFIHW